MHPSLLASPARSRRAFHRLASALLAVLITLLFARTSSAQFGPPNSELGLGLGRTKPVGEFQLHGGAFMPSNTSQANAALGGRMSALLTEQLSMGLSVDWMYHTRSSLGGPTLALPASELTARPVLDDASTQLLPVMAFLQLAPWPRAYLVPYGGAGAGYEWLVSRAHDYQSGRSFEATYSNWAWQAWAGMGLRLSKQLRLNGEAYYSGGVLGRDLHDANGVRYREVVTANGSGARAGLSLRY
jgi:hypothetical protein